MANLRFSTYYPKMTYLAFNGFCHDNLKKSGYDPINFEIRSIEICKSTNDEVNKHLKSYPNSIVLSMTQEDGRGRDGKIWHSTIGGIWMSIGINTQSKVMELSSIVVQSIHKVLSSYVKCIIKDPNDILVGTKKLCGVLVETKSKGSDFEQVVIGIGVNVYNEIHDELLDSATRLKEYCDPPSVPELSSKIAVEVLDDLSKILNF